MSHWITYPKTLTGKVVDLISLNKTHFAELETLASEKKIWEFYAYDGSNRDKFISIFNTACLEQERGTQFPFVVFHKQEKRVIGSTRFLDLQPAHKKLEIGSTWLHPDFWGTSVNLECKLLLLTYCFEMLQTLRVQFKTDEVNVRSRKAIEKIGGRFEGILRNDILRDNGTNRNSAYYSIISSEWSQQKDSLTKLLDAQLAAGR
jgi:RimJ/RimL family protein N-acetyltransferase